MAIPVLLVLAFALPTHGQTITLEGDVWAPYVMDPATGSSGFMVDIAQAALTKAGYKVEFKIIPWSRSLEDTEQGITTGIVGIYFSQAAERKYILPGEELGISVNGFFVLKNTPWKYSGLKSLETVVLATIADYDYGELLPYINQAVKANSPKVQVMPGNDAIQKNLKKLLAGHVTVVVEDVVVVSYVTKKMGIANQIKAAGRLPTANRAGIAFSPKNPRAKEYARALAEGIRKLRQSGELQKILDKYGVSDWK